MILWKRILKVFPFVSLDPLIRRRVSLSIQSLLYVIFLKSPRLLKLLRRKVIDLFFSRNTRPKTLPSNPGSRIQEQFQRSVDIQGKTVLEKVGEIDLQDRINSFADEVDINRIIKRAANGDIDILRRSQGFYADLSGMPTNVHELNVLIKKSQEVYDSMTEDMKQGRSFDSFMSDIKNYDQLVKFASQKIRSAQNAAQAAAQNAAQAAAQNAAQAAAPAATV